MAEPGKFKPRPHPRLSAVAFLSPFPSIDGETGTQRMRHAPSALDTSGEPSGLNQALFPCLSALPSTGRRVLLQSLNDTLAKSQLGRDWGHLAFSDIPQRVNEEQLPALPARAHGPLFPQGPQSRE